MPRYIRKPFKGSVAYEWQVMGLVLQVLYPHSSMYPSRKKWKVRLSWDSYWTGRETISPLAKLCVWLSTKGELWESSNGECCEHNYRIGPLTIRSGVHPGVNYYGILLRERSLWWGMD